MLVVIIIGVIASVAVPRMAGKTEDARRVAAKQNILTLSAALDQFEMHMGRYPGSEEGLNALLERPPASTQEDGWRGPYLRDLPLDPWNRDFVYRYPAEVGVDFDLICLGRDGEEGTDDDVTSFKKRD